MTVYLTVKQLIEVQDVCDNGIYLRWINDYGGIDQYYFTGNIAELPQVDNVNYFEKYIDDLLNETGNFEVISKDFKENIRCFAKFDKENSEGFKQLIRSRSIEMYVLGEWVKIDVALESFVVERYGSFGKIAIQIILPKIYVR